ncbi:hypothetical protein AcV5_007507 [Taiwanofungus camphoratus]|nr:hypothetical protein AcV5_007507 [Antrodia cinnamomea]
MRTFCEFIRTPPLGIPSPCLQSFIFNLNNATNTRSGGSLSCAHCSTTIRVGDGAFDRLTNLLQPSLDDEAVLRKLFASEKTNARLDDEYVALVNLFDAPADIRTTRA